MNGRRKIYILLFAAMLVGGCRKERQGQPAAAQPAPAELRLAYFANVTHAQAVLGVASGEFQAALGPVKLKTRVFNAGPELIQSLNAGEVDIGYIGPGPVLMAHANSGGQAVRVISGAAANGVVIVARKDAGIATLADLRGKRIATPQLGNTQDVSARHYLVAVLGQANADNVLPVPNSQQSGLMARGKIDAAWVPEPWGARLMADTGAILVGEEKDLWPRHQFAMTVIITTPQFLANHPDLVEKILTVHHHWTQRLRSSPGQCESPLGTALAALTGKQLPADVLHASVQRTQFTDDPLPDTFAAMGKWSADLGFIKIAPDLTGLFEMGMIERLGGATATTMP
ncbi:MAG: aliphatic sulfonate ABC transporter substrate-binding protein [Tepidisphaeraceae bacterium]|jgi:NitT/TauT family transport system substrate-binding protein